MSGRHAVALVTALVTPEVILAQGDCFPATGSNEARSFAILSVPLAFSGAGSMGGKQLVIGVEAVSIPEVPRELATPTTCRPGKGPDNTNPLPGAGRLRLMVTLGGWTVSAGWIPPVRLSGVRANLVGLGFGRPIALGSNWALRPRVHALLGSLHAPITCDDDALRDPASECFGGTRSNDRWTPGIFGAEVALVRAKGTVRPHVGVGYTMLRPRFQVNFTNAQGSTDSRRISVNLSRVALFSGMSTGLGRFVFTLEGYATVGEPIAVRFVTRTPLLR